METGQEAEARFGRAVRYMRTRQKLSQKGLAEALTQEGVNLDGPAISRLEKGGRAIRLNEAVALAEVLDVALEVLVSFDNPAAQLSEVRRRADMSMNDMEWHGTAWCRALLDARGLLRENPELLRKLRDESLAPPDSVDDYLDWVLRRVDRLWGDPLPVDADDYAALSQILVAMVPKMVSVSVEDDDPEA